LGFRSSRVNRIEGTPGSDFGSVQDYDVVLTQYDDQQDFGEYQTFFIVDSVYHYQDPDDPSENDISRDNDGLIIATVKDNLTALGYQYKADADSLDPSDILVIVGASSSDWYSIWYPGPPQATYAYTTGTLFIDMWDTKNADQEADVAPIPWYSRINGIMNDTSASRVQRLQDAINKAFAQSPYLGRP
jgi:hypothetical protein